MAWRSDGWHFELAIAKTSWVQLPSSNQSTWLPTWLLLPVVDTSSICSYSVHLYVCLLLLSPPTNRLLASCLINAQPLPAHRPAADDNSLVGCTGHQLTDDWSLASTHFVDSLCPFRYSFWVLSFIEPDVLKTIYRSTIPLRFIWSICSGN